MHVWVQGEVKAEPAQNVFTVLGFHSLRKQHISVRKEFAQKS